MTAFNTPGTIDGSAAQLQAGDAVTMCNCTGACKRPGGLCPVSIKAFGVGYTPAWMSPVPLVPAGHTTVGTCSLCRGPVTVPSVWLGVTPPTPVCASCGAVAKPDYGPVIQMEKRAF